MTTVKELCLKYFSVDDATKFTWKCQCGAVIIQKKNTGWTNLANHIKSQHGEDPKSVPTGQATISFAKSKRVTSKGSNIYCWLNWVCSSLKPFSFVDDVLTREYTKLEPISHNSLKKYMELVTKEVEKRIQSALPEKLAHRFNLAVSLFLKEHTEIIAKISDIMIKLRTLKYRGKLRQKTDLGPVLKNETRWSRTFAMLNRYIRLHPFLLEPEFSGDQAFATLLLSPHILEPMQKSFIRQSLNQQLSKSKRKCMIHLMTKNLLLWQYWKKKLFWPKLDPMNKKTRLQNLWNDAKWQKLNMTTVTLKHDFYCQPQTCLRGFFSVSGLAYDDFRQNMTPMNLEMQLFLKTNKRFWDEELVSKCCAW